MRKKRDASKKLNELKESIYNDELSLPNTINFENFLLDFLEKYKLNLSITTYNCYFRICNKYIIPILGKYKLEDLRPIHLQNYVDSLVRNFGTTNHKNTYKYNKSSVKKSI